MQQFESPQIGSLAICMISQAVPPEDKVDRPMSLQARARAEYAVVDPTQSKSLKIDNLSTDNGI